jgi:hypothetical protein
MWGKRNKQSNNKRDRDDDAIIQSTNDEKKEHDQYCLPSSVRC